MIIKHKETSVFYTVEGSGSAVVLLHGFLENYTMWNKIAQTLSKKHKVISIDLLGHGATGNIGYIHTMEDMANVVAEVIKKVGVRRVTLVGHSMGGYVALAFAKKYKAKVKGLCLLNATSQADTEERKILRERACKMAQTNYEALVTMSISNLFAKTTRVQFLKEIAELKKQALATTVQGYIAATKGMQQRENLGFILQQIPNRLLIAGEEDSLLPKKMLLEEAEKTETPICFVPHGHMSYIEAKDLVIANLLKFLK